MRYLFAILLFLILASQVEAGLPRSNNFMSKYGYDRWQYFRNTGIWAPYESQ